MTAYTAYQIIEKFSISLDETIIEICANAAMIGMSFLLNDDYLGGTSAMLRAGDKITLRNLFYGMLLPSGNDAAIAIAIYFG